MSDHTDKQVQQPPTDERMDPMKNPALLAFVLRTQMRTNPDAIHDFFDTLDALTGGEPTPTTLETKK
jgi:hypothetical protein